MVESGDNDGDMIGGRRSRAKTEKEERVERYDQTIKEYRSGAWTSIRQCAAYFRVDHSSLSKLLKDPEAKYKRKGRVSPSIYSTGGGCYCWSHHLVYGDRCWIGHLPG